ncbi:Rho GTPase activation protein [Dipodascopsis tothii]|uniref:Rho GTPase activation protein n=1 Tax=Dipodascopsis tothii TaxID=44089 RepID=UPI0034CFC58C
MASVGPVSTHDPMMQPAGYADTRALQQQRQSKRYSVTALYVSMASEQDTGVDDALARAQKRLRDLKSQISVQSKKNFLLERDVRYLDSRIALLIQNKIALEEQSEVTSRLEESELKEGTFPDHRKLDKYGNLFFLLQTEPRHIATLCRLLSMSEIDSFLQTVMFTIYGNQYEQREEHLLLTMFQSVLSSEFDTATEYSSLLRANTAVSRMMTTYTRRGPGQAYLKSVLADKINPVIDRDEEDLEVNPLKVYEEVYNREVHANGGACPPGLLRSVSAEAAAEHPEVRDIIGPRIAKLLEIAELFLGTIISSIDEVPYGIRWICKQIRSLTRRKYPNTDDSTGCSLIGAFFFLRFINPAIVTPHAYMLVDSVPSEHPRRTLTLVAKMLQNLANKPTYSKEHYMASLNDFIVANKARMNRFLNDLCDVPDFYETLEMDQLVALSKDISLNITINEVYTMHALLERHGDALCPDKLSRLFTLLKSMGAAPAVLPRAENYVIDLPLFSRWENPIDDLSTSLDITHEDVLFMEAKSVMVQILRTLPPNHPVVARPLDLYKIADTAATMKDAALVKKGLKVLQLLQDLEHTNTTLAEEVEEELAQLGSVRDKVLDELKALEAVYKTIRDHNDYLRGQLDTYKSYLRNVRIQSGPKKTENDRVGLVAIHGGKAKKQAKPQNLGPYRFTQQQLEKEGVIVLCNVPDHRRQNLFFFISSPIPGTFVISLHYKGRSRGLLELSLKLDDLLEMENNEVEVLDLEYVVVNVPRTLSLLQRQFSNNKWRL